MTRQLAAGLLLVALVATTPALALETDQYLAWGHELADSTDRINAFLNTEVEEFLAQVNRKGDDRLSCPDLPRKLYRQLFPMLLWSPYRKFLLEDPAIDRFPPSDVGYVRYYRDSVYRHPVFPFFLPLGRTVKVDGVHVGVDKLAGHMFSFGRRYYNRYLKARDRGLSEDQALRKVMRWGIMVERYFVGGLIDGVFSYADLEANYQGLRLAREMCEGETPYLARSDGGWTLTRPVDLRDYVSPLWDESYNNSHFTGPRRWGVTRVLTREVCPRFRTPEIQAMLRRYHERREPSFAHDLIEELYRERGKNPQLAQSLDVLCGDGADSGSRLQAASAPAAAGVRNAGDR